MVAGLFAKAPSAVKWVDASADAAGTGLTSIRPAEGPPNMAGRPGHLKEDGNRPGPPPAASRRRMGNPPILRPPPGNYAAASAGRFSRIGRWTMALKAPTPTPIHQTKS